MHETLRASCLLATCHFSAIFRPFSAEFSQFPITYSIFGVFSNCQIRRIRWRTKFNSVISSSTLWAEIIDFCLKFWKIRGTQLIISLTISPFPLFETTLSICNISLAKCRFFSFSSHFSLGNVAISQTNQNSSRLGSIFFYYKQNWFVISEKIGVRGQGISEEKRGRDRAIEQKKNNRIGKTIKREKRIRELIGEKRYF